MTLGRRLFLSRRTQTETKEPVKHISHDRLLEVARSLTLETEVTNPTSDLVLSPEESAHLVECPECVDAFAEIIRQIIRQRDYRAAAAGKRSI
jgi:hypothetical protein